MLGAQHVPLAVASRISEALGDARSLGLISDYVRVELDRSVHLERFCETIDQNLAEIVSLVPRQRLRAARPRHSET